MYVASGHRVQYLFSSNERRASDGQPFHDHILFMEKQNPQINTRTRIIIQSIQSVDCRDVRLIFILFFFFLWWLLLCIIYVVRSGRRHDERNKINEFDKQKIIIYQNSFSIFYASVN